MSSTDKILLKGICLSSCQAEGRCELLYEFLFSHAEKAAPRGTTPFTVPPIEELQVLVFDNAQRHARTKSARETSSLASMA